jgi:phosphate transport system protein
VATEDVGPLRQSFHDELDQLRLQVELMGVRVDENLERMRVILRTGDETAARRALEADDEIDAMNVSLTEHCYSLLNRQAPMASELRFVVSVVRIISEFERVGDLALRVVKLASQQPVLSTAKAAWDILLTLTDESVEEYRTALRAWAGQDLGLATDLANRNRSLDVYNERLLAELMHLEGPDAVRIAMGVFAAGRATERIADHAAIIGARIRYLITGEPAHLAAEVR